MFFNKAKPTADAEAPKKRSVFGLLFNPEIGKTLQPLSETTGVFVQLIAMIFAMNHLFPKNHPAILGIAGARLTLSEIFSTSWKGLSFTKAGIPKVILFFAVTGTIVFAVLSTITALLAGFMGTAHAATAAGAGSSGIFSPASNDLAQNFLDYIFKGQPLSNYLSQDGAPIAQTISIQCSMISALGFYSNGMLVFAAIILFYHLVSMVVMTAHEGVPMGKRASQVWAPIRLVVAVGLLVPMGSPGGQCSTGGVGLNAGQYIVIQMASWGSGLASQTWKIFLSAWSEPTSNFIRPSAPSVEDIVKDITLMEACRYAWNYQVCRRGTAGSDQSQCDTDPNGYSGSALQNEIIPAPTQKTNTVMGELHYNYSPKDIAKSDKICGSFIVRNPTAVNYARANSLIDNPRAGTGPATIAGSLEGEHKATIITMIDNKDFERMGAKVAMMMESSGDSTLTDNNDYWSLVNTYQKTLKQNLDSALTRGSFNSSGNAEIMASLGWAGAGAWINTIARDQGAIVNAYENGLPSTQRPDLDKLDSDPTTKEIATALRHLSIWIKHEDPQNAQVTACRSQEVAASGGGSASGVVSTPGSGIGSSVANNITDEVNAGRVNFGKAKTLMTNIINDLSGTQSNGGDITHRVFSIIDAQATRSGVWNDTSVACPNTPGSFTLGAQLVTSNPLQEFSFWGHANLRAAFSLWESIVQLSIASAVYQQEKEVNEFSTSGSTKMRTQIVEEGLKSRIYEFLAGIFGLFAIIFMMSGFTVAFVVPLLPFFRFFFNILTWIVSTLEAVVAIPLVALAHLNPEGEGLPGQSAKSAYFLIFNIFVRPVMTVFGLIAGLIVFYIAIMLLNITFAIAVAGTNASSHAGGYDTLVRIAFTITYAAAVYSCANNAFKTIGFFPEHAMRWIGQQAHHERMGDGGRTVQAALGQTQGVLGEKAIGAIRLKA